MGIRHNILTKSCVVKPTNKDDVMAWFVYGMKIIANYNKKIKASNNWCPTADSMLFLIKTEPSQAANAILLMEACKFISVDFTNYLLAYFDSNIERNYNSGKKILDWWMLGSYNDKFWKFLYKWETKEVITEKDICTFLGVTDMKIRKSVMLNNLFTRQGASVEGNTGNFGWFNVIDTMRQRFEGKKSAPWKIGVSTLIGLVSVIPLPPTMFFGTIAGLAFSAFTVYKSANVKGVTSFGASITNLRSVTRSLNLNEKQTLSNIDGIDFVNLGLDLDAVKVSDTEFSDFIDAFKNGEVANWKEYKEGKDLVMENDVVISGTKLVMGYVNHLNSAGKVVATKLYLGKDKKLMLPNPDNINTLTKQNSFYYISSSNPGIPVPVRRDNAEDRAFASRFGLVPTPFSINISGLSEKEIDAANESMALLGRVNVGWYKPGNKDVYYYLEKDNVFVLNTDFVTIIKNNEFNVRSGRMYRIGDLAKYHLVVTGETKAAIGTFYPNDTSPEQTTGGGGDIYDPNTSNTSENEADAKKQEEANAKANLDNGDNTTMLIMVAAAIIIFGMES